MEPLLLLSFPIALWAEVSSLGYASQAVSCQLSWIYSQLLVSLSLLPAPLVSLSTCACSCVEV